MSTITVEQGTGWADIYRDGVAVGQVLRVPVQQPNGQWVTYWSAWTVKDGPTKAKFGTKTDAIMAVKRAVA